MKPKSLKDKLYAWLFREQIKKQESTIVLNVALDGTDGVLADLRELEKEIDVVLDRSVAVLEILKELARKKV